MEVYANNSTNSYGYLWGARVHAKNIEVNKTDKNVCPHAVYILMGKADRYTKK